MMCSDFFGSLSMWKCKGRKFAPGFLHRTHLVKLHRRILFLEHDLFGNSLRCLNIRQKKHPYLSSFSFFWEHALFLRKPRDLTSIFFGQPPTEVPGNGFGSCRSWRRVAGISQQIWALGKLRPKRIAGCPFPISFCVFSWIFVEAHFY